MNRKTFQIVEGESLPIVEDGKSERQPGDLLHHAPLGILQTSVRQPPLLTKTRELPTTFLHSMADAHCSFTKTFINWSPFQITLSDTFRPSKSQFDSFLYRFFQYNPKNPALVEYVHHVGNYFEIHGVSLLKMRSKGFSAAFAV